MRRVLLLLSVFNVLPLLLQAAPAANDNKLPAAPLSFIENKGQVTGTDKKPRVDIDLKLEGKGMNVFIGDAQLHYVWRRQMGEATAGERTKAIFETYRMDVELVGADKNAQMVKESEQAYYENYFLPQCPGGVTAHTFSKVTYKNIYPNIDWVLYAGNNELKYDFVVRPGGKASDIRLRYKGATALRMKDGAVTARTPFGSVTEKKPYSYDAVTKKEIPSSFILKNNELRFAVAKSENTIVIDPVLAWGSYYGESGQNDFAEGVATDATGNVFMAGYTYSDDDITDPFASSHQQNLQGLIDAFIVKFNSEGTRMWATYYGSAGNEFCYDVITNKTGDVFICGDSDGPAGLGFPAWVHQDQNQSAPDSTDAFIARFNTSGMLIWGSYYGGAGNETARKMAVDGFGEVYMTGMTRSNNKIHFGTGFKSTFGGGYSDAYVAKFSTSGTVVWATYLGGWLDDAGWSVAVDSNDRAFVAGETFSIDFYCTPDAELDTIIPHDPPPAVIVDPYNAFIVKFSPPGAVIYSSMYEGWDGIAGYSRPFDLCVNSTGDVYMATGKIVKFNNAGKYQWAKGRSGTRLRVTSEDSIYAAGSTSLTTGIATPGSQQPTFAGGVDGFIAQYDSSGNKSWGSYYGGIYNDRIEGLALDKRNKIFVCGNTNSPGGIATSTGHKPAWTGDFLSNDAFIGKWHDTTVSMNPVTDTLLCPPDTVNISYIVEVIFGATNVFTAQLSDANGSFANPTVIGAFASNNSGSFQCPIPASIPPGNGYRIRLVSSSPMFVTKDNGKDIRILERAKPVITGIAQACTNDSVGLTVTSTTTAAAFTWTRPGGTVQPGATVQIPNVADVHAGRYVVNASNLGCGSKDSIDVIVHPRPYVIKITHPVHVCEGKQINLDVEGSMTEVKYFWAGPNGYTSTEKSPIIQEAGINHAGAYFPFMTSNKGCTSDSNSIFIDVFRLEAHINGVDLRTPGDTIKLEGSANRDSVTWSWEGPSGFTSNIQNPMLEDITVNQRGDYFLTVMVHGCIGKASTHVRVTEEIKFQLFPSPNKGSFTIKGNTAADQVINFEVTDLMGKSIYRDQVKTFRKHFTKAITLPGVPAAGVYILRLDVADKPGDIKFVIME